MDSRQNTLEHKWTSLCTALFRGHITFNKTTRGQTSFNKKTTSHPHQREALN